MALLYRATIVPTKLELIQAWIPTQPWLGPVDASAMEVVDAFRFDDPAGEVGIETLLLRAVGGEILQVPVTYRPAALAEAEASLVGTTAHSVLGRRWVYDGCGDPVYVQALATAIATGGTQAELEVYTETGLVRREPTARVTGSGEASVTAPAFAAAPRSARGAMTVFQAGATELVLVRVLGGITTADLPTGSETLMGTWSGQSDAVLLGFLSR